MLIWRGGEGWLVLPYNTNPQPYLQINLTLYPLSFLLADPSRTGCKVKPIPLGNSYWISVATITLRFVAGFCWHMTIHFKFQLSFESSSSLYLRSTTTSSIFFNASWVMVSYELVLLLFNALLAWVITYYSHISEYLQPRT